MLFPEFSISPSGSYFILISKVGIRETGRLDFLKIRNQSCRGKTYFPNIFINSNFNITTFKGSLKSLRFGPQKIAIP